MVKKPDAKASSAQELEAQLSVLEKRIPIFRAMGVTYLQVGDVCMNLEPPEPPTPPENNHDDLEDFLSEDKFRPRREENPS